VRHCFPLVLVCLISSACASQADAWKNLDYKSVYIRAKNRENDPNYQQPTNVGCMDEDLYNCQ
jgi:hypothetical protein